MSFFKASKKQEDVKQGGGTKHIVGSGIYPVTILAPVINVSKGGSTTVDMYVDHADQKQIVYGNLRITNNDDTPNGIGAKTFNQLVIIAGLEEVADPIEVDLPIGKGGAMKSCSVADSLADIDVYMRIQMEYSEYQGNIQEKKVIKSFFRASDGASAEEICNGSEAGVALASEQKYADYVTYKDDLTEEQVKAWIKDKRPKGTASAQTGSSSDKKPSKAPSFGAKRFGSSSE